MKIAAVIAEYNPFHNGHRYQLTEIRRRSGADYIIALMSGDFVQRGAPAILDKYERASLALSEGADLVLELPVIYALGSAGYFAKGAISILNQLPVDYLCFGCEDADLRKLKAAARLFSDEPAEYRSLLQTGLKKGLSFPAARAQAAEELLPRLYPALFSNSAEIRAFLHAPNNALAISYLSALAESHSSIEEIAIPRIGKSYHDLSLSEFASASAIRKVVYDCRKKGIFLPETPLSATLSLETFSALQKALDGNYLQDENDYLSMIRYLLLSSDLDQLSFIEGVSRDLAMRLKKNLNLTGDFSALLNSYANKSVTKASLSRILFRLLLNIPKTLQEDALAKSALYARVLGVKALSQTGDNKKIPSGILSLLKKESSIPLLINPASDEKQLDRLQKSVFEKDLFADRLYHALASSKSGLDFPNEYQRRLLCK
jgi:predicted nucleotidyltransferase